MLTSMDKKEFSEEFNPNVIMGGQSFKLSDLLDENNTEAKTAIEDWISKKQKSLDRAEKRALNKGRKKRLG